MIEWSSVLWNGFWIVGCAVLLAGLSYHYWRAMEVKRPFRHQLSQPAFEQIFWLSVCLIAVGLTGTSREAWEMAVWIGFTIISAYKMYQLKLSGRSAGHGN